MVPISSSPSVASGGGPGGALEGPSGVGSVTVRFWAGARAAAGVAECRVEAVTVGQVRAELVHWQPSLAAVLEVSSLLVDGQCVTDDTLRVGSGALVEVLPPFAGG